MYASRQSNDEGTSTMRSWLHRGTTLNQYSRGLDVVLEAGSEECSRSIDVRNVMGSVFEKEAYKACVSTIGSDPQRCCSLTQLLVGIVSWRRERRIERER